MIKEKKKKKGIMRKIFEKTPRKSKVMSIT
jgi:hypothetical protein